VKLVGHVEEIGGRLPGRMVPRAEEQVGIAVWIVVAGVVVDVVVDVVVGLTGMRGSAGGRRNIPRPVLSPGVGVPHVAFLQRRQFLLQILERRHRQRRAVQIQLPKALQVL